MGHQDIPEAPCPEQILHPIIISYTSLQYFSIIFFRSHSSYVLMFFSALKGNYFLNITKHHVKKD